MECEPGGVQVRLLPAHVPGVPQSVDVSRLLLRAINNLIFLRVRSAAPHPRIAGCVSKPHLRFQYYTHYGAFKNSHGNTLFSKRPICG